MAGIPLDRAVLAEVVTTLGSIPIAEYATPSTAELPEAVRKYIKAHDGMLLANHGALTVGGDLFAAYFKMETIEHFAKISLVARLLGGENLLSREEVMRLQGLRGMRHRGAGADLRRSARRAAPWRQVLDGAPRDVPGPVQAPSGGPTAATARRSASRRRAEIRLTYRELTALIADAVNLRVSRRTSARSVTERFKFNADALMLKAPAELVEPAVH